jgi:hypothetical protein
MAISCAIIPPMDIPRSLGHDWYVNLFPCVRPKAILQVSHPQIGVAN